MPNDDAMDFLMNSGGGAPTGKFLTMGTVHKGRVLSMEKKQQTDMKTKRPLTWDDGSPRWELVVTMQTEERDSEIEDDDGKRRIFAKGNMMQAIKDAIVDSGWRGATIVGGTLAVKYVSDGEPTAAGFNPPKQYAARFEAPAAVDDLPDDEPEYETF